MLKFIQSDLVAVFTLLNYVHSAYLYFLDCNLFGLLSKLLYISIYVKSPVAKSLKFSLFLLFAINLYSLLVHCLSTIEPGLLTDFIGEGNSQLQLQLNLLVPTFKMLLYSDFISLIMGFLCLFSKLQETTEEDEPDLDDEFCYNEETLDIVSTFKAYWNYQLLDEEPEPEPEADTPRLPV
ncbi:hypothetical protein DSO57_1018942 [Entomophthora muscae]|uniref:Uncharacterized protein n=1 Tax=Entomophthora muscae TaxID=34485 RepID=A0ACC2U2H2_9FUNG|nr:hypothetical protein DSO57_1018942 [Entomophthora muscae]